MKYKKLHITTGWHPSHGTLPLWSMALIMPLFGLAVWYAWQFGIEEGQSRAAFQSLDSIQVELQKQLEEINLVKADMDNNLGALAIQLGSLRAHNMRLNALGERLVGMADLDPGEFDFQSEPAVGDVAGESGATVTLDDISVEMQKLAQSLSDREEKLVLMEEFLSSRQLLEELLPAGSPLNKGWMSSGFGTRLDPFTGKKAFHKGLDFVGKPGSEVISVASGVVTKAGLDADYGNLVEIQHADGYITRYAHNKENLVREGELVEKGQTIALLGSTGRTSGPHVHFEVLKDDKLVDPKAIIGR